MGKLSSMDDVEEQLPSSSTPQTQQPQEQRWWYYPLVAFFDLQVNCLAVRSLAFADYTSADIMLNLTIPFVSLLGCVMRGRKYSWHHTVGYIIASAGGIALFFGSYYRDQADESSQQMYGCFLVLLVAFLYGAPSITNQLCLKAQGVDMTIESLGMISAWGSGLAMIQMVPLQRAFCQQTSQQSRDHAARVLATNRRRKSVSISSGNLRDDDAVAELL